LFWLSKDLFEERTRDSTEPEARALAELRNHLEHKYTRIREMGDLGPAADDPLRDTLVYAISQHDLECKTLRLMQLVRSAIIYLCLGMHQEESKRAKGNESRSLSMPISTWNDDWKR
jgi:hypothetical protein